MNLLSWGMYPKIKNKSFLFHNRESLHKLLKSIKECIPYGYGRSYGDSAIAQNIVYCKPYNYFLEFDEIAGIVHCQSGVLLSEILEVCVPKGWFLKVTPGTKLITVGGAIASDIHGKNHHVEGCFSESLHEMSVMLSNGDTVTCKKGDELFMATCEIGRAHV